jgi:hypothetical protein
MKRNILLTLLLVINLAINAQEVISAQGASYSNSNGSIDFTIGEVVTATLTNTNNILTQGFHQTNLSVLAVDDFDINFQARVFPNPTQNVLQLDIQNFSGLNYKLYDIQGRQLSISKIDKKNTVINTAQYAKGMYLLVILNENKQKLKTYRIIKN